MSDRDKSRLRWRCRRGMKELDVLLTRYLEQAWDDASTSEKEKFEQLLGQADPLLYSWFIGTALPDSDLGLDPLLAKISQLDQYRVDHTPQ